MMMMSRHLTLLASSASLLVMFGNANQQTQQDEALEIWKRHKVQLEVQAELEPLSKIEQRFQNLQAKAKGKSAAQQPGPVPEPVSQPEEDEAIEAVQEKSEIATPKRLTSVMPLNRFIFDGNVQGSHVRHWFVLFCYEWHPPCAELSHALKEEIAGKFESMLNKNDYVQATVRFGEVDCSEDRVLCNEQDVHHYPRVVHYFQTEQIAQWNGGMTHHNAPRLDKWLQGRAGKIIKGKVQSSDESLSSLLPQGLSFVLVCHIGVALLLVLAVQQRFSSMWREQGTKPQVDEGPRGLAAMLPESWVADSPGSLNIEL